mmetsp:Transcript_3149/g.3759  ORF Transcript_3149/g.3759 Transcript_3149/m.3759 type:complete len:287 (+) Transcript_3149:26-886(+)
MEASPDYEFFGLRLHSGKNVVDAKVNGTVHITQAALVLTDAPANKKAAQTVSCGMHVVATLRPWVRESVAIDLRLSADSLAATEFNLSGDLDVDLTGYISRCAKKVGPKSAKRKQPASASKAEAPEAKKKKLKAAAAEVEETEQKATKKTKPTKKKSKKGEKTPEKKKSEKRKIVTLGGGLEYQDLKVGKGAQVKKGMTAKVRYTGMLKNGTIFDSNLPRGQPFLFTVGGGDVIKGWDKGVEGMRVGGKRNLLIPSNMGYGAKGAPPKIPRNAELLFQVVLVDTWA